ncbi:MAG: 5-methyltetrahydropteroyltriglutamate--homocysteine S-methyltransferase [Betaproteobacteria bacterium]|nr:5-methyltetrahydropteroyltriglutamate--homocysteine S-methyltransferase [Betaproteobacteria bacterium]
MSSAAQQPPFRADHVGSLLRPAELKAARERAKRGEIDAAELRSVEDKCIRDAVAFQESLGLQSITDGEFRRDWWHIDFLRGFDGVTTVRGVTLGVHFPGADEQPPLMRVTGKIRRSKPSMLDHFKFLKSVTRRTPKFCMPSPALLHARGDREALKSTYPDVEEFWSDLTQAYREEIRDLHQAGCRYLQIDDTTIAMMGDPKVQETFRKLGDDPKADTARYADAVNTAIRDVPDEMTVCVHTCRGNVMSTWLASGSYDFVAETVFTRLDVDGFFLEYDSARAGGFEPLRYVPKGKKVVLGLVSSKFPELEDKDDLRRRIEAAAKFVPIENLCLSPQCGFSSTHHGNKMTADDQRRKLALVLEVARDVWGSA